MDIRDQYRSISGIRPPSVVQPSWSPAANGLISPRRRFPQNDNLTPDIDTSDLIDSHAKRKNQRAKVYEKVYRKCCQRIRYSNDTLLKKECMFQVPEVQLWDGIPRYQVNAVISYIMIRLNQKGFKTRYLPPRGIFISWQKVVSGDRGYEKVVRYELDEINTKIPVKAEVETTKDRLLHENCKGACCADGNFQQPKLNKKQGLEMDRRKQQAEIERLIERRDRR
jgi:hypothetical protein